VTLEMSESGHAAPEEVADRLGRHLVRLIRLIDRSRAHHAATRDEYGMEHAAYVLLFHLVSEGPRRAGELAEAVHSDPSTLSRQVANLVQLGRFAGALENEFEAALGPRHRHAAATDICEEEE
jgi:hypothetical protein